MYQSLNTNTYIYIKTYQRGSVNDSIFFCNKTTNCVAIFCEYILVLVKKHLSTSGKNFLFPLMSLNM